MDYWFIGSLASIAVLFVAFALFKDALYFYLKIPLCAICASVSSTWIGLLVLRNAFGYDVPTLLLAVLMAQPIVGLMYQFEMKAKLKGKTNLLWLKPFIILLGTATVYSYLSSGITLLSLTLILTSGIFLCTMLWKLFIEPPGTSFEKPVRSSDSVSKKSLSQRSIMDKLKNCC